MKHDEFSRTLARENRLSGAAARERIDEVVHNILKRLKMGESVDLPGVGKLVQKKPRTR